MNQYDYINDSNFEDKIYINNNNQITDEINQSISIKLSELEQDIFTLINFIRTNPIDYCNNLIHKATNKKKQEISKIIQYLEDVHRKEILLPYKKVPEISDAARNLLNNLSHHYNINRNLNLKELDPSCLNLKTRLSNYGERTGTIFETVLIKMDNPEDIINHILMEEKGRNMLLSYKMKYIGIACALFPSNLLCSVIDIVQDFVPFKNKNTLSTNFLNSSNNKTNNNISFFQKSHDNNSYIRDRKKFKTNSEPVSLIDNLNYKNSKDNLKLNIVIPKHKQNDEKKNIEINNDFNDKNSIENKNRIIKKNENESCDNNKQNNNLEKNGPYKSPKKINQPQFNKKNFVQISPISESSNTIINKTTFPKRYNSNIIIKKDQNSIKDNNNGSNENIDTIKFTIAGRINNQQREIEEISKKNLIKSNSICSFNLNSHNFKTNNKNKFQRLNHQEKMEILHKINHRNNKTPNSQSPRDKNSENAVNIISNNKKSNDDIQKNINNYEINFENKSRRSPSRSEYNQEYYEINSETDKNNYNALNKYMSKDDKNNYDDGTNQTLTDLKSNQGLGNNEEYSRNKISEIKNELLYFKNEIKKELKDEVREEIRNELNKKMLIENKQRNKPTIIQLEPDYDIQMHNNNYNEMNKRNSHEINNEKIYYKNNNIGNNYYNKNKEKNRWSSSVEKYYYIKNNNNNINNINNTNIILPNNNFEYKQYTHNNYYKPTKPRKSFDLKEFINNDKNHNESDDRQMKEKFEQLNYIPIINNNDRALNNDDISNYSRGSNQNQNINKENSNKKNMNESYFIEGYKMNNRQDIKKLIKLYNIAKEDKRNKSIIENNNVHDIINNNKSITNYNFNQNESKNDNIEIDINGDLNNSKKININNNILENNFADNNSKAEKLKRDFNNNYNNNFNNNENNANNEEEDNSGEGDFIKGHRFQIKYEKVKPKGQIYNKSQIPKPRNSSVKKAQNYLYNNINNDSNRYIKDNPFNKNEDIVNQENTIISNETSSKETTKNKEREYKIEKTSYIKKYNETITYNAGKGQNKKNSNNNINSNEKLSITGKFIEENNIVDNNNPNLKSNDTVDIKNFMDKNVKYNESKEKAIISKKEKMDISNIVTTIITKTSKIYTPNKINKNEDYVVNKNMHKKQSDLIKEYKKYEKINNTNNMQKNNDNNDGNKYNNKIITKKLSLGRKTYDKSKLYNNYKNKTNYLEIENDSLKTPNLFKKSNNYYQKEYYNNINMSPRFNNINSQTNSSYKMKKYSPYPYYPYEYTVNYNNNNVIPSRRLNYNNGSVEKKYIKDPEGNLIETYVKKTKYNDGSVLLEYI